MKNVLSSFFRPVLVASVLLILNLILFQACGPCRRSGNRQDAVTYLKEGLRYEKDSLFTMAMESYEKAIQSDPSFRDAWFQAGNLYDKLNLFGKAQKAFEEVIRLNPCDAAAYNNLANVYGRTGKIEEAIRYYRKAAECNDTLASVHYNLAQSLLFLHDWAGAEQAYQKACERAPGEIRYREALGVFYLNRNNYPAAIRTFREALQKPASHPVFYRYLSDAWRGLAQYDSAIAMMDLYRSRIEDDQEKTIASNLLRELKKEQALRRSSELRKKMATQPKKL